MTKKPEKRVKHIPQRTCIGCRQVLTKRSLVRLVRSAQGIRLDATGKLEGRGAYLHNQKSCWDKALKGSLAQALKSEISAADLQTLKEYALTLPEENPNESPVTQNAH